VADREQNWLAAVTTEGRLLIFKISDLPQLGKGKGNKIIGIPVSGWPVAKNMSPTSPYSGRRDPGAAGRQAHPVAEGRRPRALKVSVDAVVTNCHAASSGWMRCWSKTSIRPVESIYDLTRRSTLCAGVGTHIHG
jgi:hypothetical protein